MPRLEDMTQQEWLTLVAATVAAVVVIFAMMIVLWRTLAKVNTRRVRRHISKDNGQLMTIAARPMCAGSGARDNCRFDVRYVDADGQERQRTCCVSLWGKLRWDDEAEPATTAAPPDPAP